MFQRASKIIITESSASRRAHPAVGDIGYLNNMYLFFADRFILLDAFFFSYPSDKGNKKNRCERKRFIIDLGMTEKLKHKLKTYGIPKIFFTENDYVTNLTLAGHKISGSVLVESPDVSSMWYRTINRKMQSRMKVATKIPYGHIALAPTRKRSIELDGMGAVRCWIECMLPVFNAEILHIIDHGVSTPIANKASDLYYMIDFCTKVILKAGENVIILRKDAISRFGGLDLKSTVKNVQLVHAMSKSLLHNCDTKILMDKSNWIPMDMFSKEWSKYGIEHAYKRKMAGHGPGTSGVIVKFLTNLFFRHIIMPGNTESGLLSMNEAHALRWKPSKITEMSKELEDMKRAADFGSAALNRIFERDLLV